MRPLLSIPSWIFVNAMIPFFPKTHPWHGQRFTLRRWAMGATDDTLFFGAVMWVSLGFWVWFYFIIHPL